MTREISGKTKICGLIGDPVEHSVSPAMHQAAFEKLGIDYRYLPFRVRKEDLGKAIEGMRALNFSGFNVTIPHKVTIIPLLDGLDPLAEKIGAVNTIVNEDGCLRGYNTDAAGFLKAIRAHGIEPRGKNAVVLGAGGAARAITYILAENGASLTILNRHLEFDWAEELAQLITDNFKTDATALELDSENLATALDKADMLVNATSVGMSPDSGETMVPARLLRPGLVVVDIVYNPVKTRLLQEAEAAGARTIGGIDMLVWQGALAFEAWTGRSAPFDLMKVAAIQALEGHED
jgi:shikimate dehydrogenase